MMHHQPQVLSPLPEMKTQSTDQESAHPRKMSVGGNRSWSEEEEAYLLQTRMQKMPYKHIAAHLKKTELACRLHYHQLSHGSHRRKRNSSVSSTASCSSNGTSPAYALATDHDAYSQSSRQSSPMSYHGSPHVLAASITSPSRSQHKILLPKPNTLTPRESPEPYNALRINTEVAYQPRPVDTDRLRAIYEARRQQFWTTVAADYGADVSPARLEEIWRNGSNPIRPPTPDASPDGSILHNPMRRPSAFAYSSPVYSDTARHCNSTNPMRISAVPAPERQSYVLPMPVPSNGHSRAGAWSSAPRDHMPIASLLNEER